MTYVVTENCIKCKFQDCVKTCPIDCFYEGENFLVIHPDECIDCGVCEPACTSKAIVPDTDTEVGEWLAVNAKFASEWPNIWRKGELLPDAKDWNGKCGKKDMLSSNPGKGSKGQGPKKEDCNDDDQDIEMRIGIANEEFSDAYEVVPDDEDWGLFSLSEIPGPMCGGSSGGFLWFDNKNDALNFVVEHVPFGGPSSDSGEPFEVQKELRKLVKKIRNGKLNLEDARNQLNNEIGHLYLEICWWGTFEDLRSGKHPYAARVVSQFLNPGNDEDDELEAPNGRKNTIEESQIDDFNTFIREEWGISFT